MHSVGFEVVGGERRPLRQTSWASAATKRAKLASISSSLLPSRTKTSEPPEHDRSSRMGRPLASIAGRRTRGSRVRRRKQSPLPPVTPDEAGPQAMHLVEDFLPAALAGELRTSFENRFADERSSSPDRFVWDWFHVADRYTFLRSPAADFFGDASFRDLEERLLEYGENTLGCSSITTIWLSAYVDGCLQELHADVPHGPWAFVLPLTPGKPFTGGETLLLKPGTLNYFGGFAENAIAGVELPQLADLVIPEFNRLLVFDGRIPHGVRAVSGVQGLLQARVVLHGWFAEPVPYITGPINEVLATATVNKSLAMIGSKLGDLPELFGMLAARIEVEQAGVVTCVRFLSDTLRARDAGIERETRRKVLSLVYQIFTAAHFPPAESSSIIVVPIVLEPSKSN